MSLFCVTRPSSAELARFVETQREQPFSYEPVGMTRDERAPLHWTEDNYRTVLGQGAPAFQRGRELMRKWTMFDIPWIELHTRDTPIQTGACVAVAAHSAGRWVQNAARVVYVIDEPERFGFAYGTLPGHIESGEERFCVELTPEDLAVYTIRAISRPRAWLARAAYPWVRREQRRFGLQSLAAMRRAMS